MVEAIFFCMVGLPLFGKGGSGTPVFKIQVRVLGMQYFSDHIPVICTLQLHAPKMGIPNSHYNENFTSSWYKYKWKDTLKMDFLNKCRHLYSYFWNSLLKLIY